MTDSASWNYSKSCDQIYSFLKLLLNDPPMAVLSWCMMYLAAPNVRHVCLLDLIRSCWFESSSAANYFFFVLFRYVSAKICMYFLHFLRFTSLLLMRESVATISVPYVGLLWPIYCTIFKTFLWILTVCGFLVAYSILLDTLAYCMYLWN